MVYFGLGLQKCQPVLSCPLLLWALGRSKCVAEKACSPHCGQVANEKTEKDQGPKIPFKIMTPVTYLPSILPPKGPITSQKASDQRPHL